jgi:WD40 repeat protein
VKRQVVTIFFGCVLTIVGLCSNILSIQAVPVIQTSHIGPVSGIDCSDDGNFLFSCGDDGTLKVWDVNKAELLASIRISFRPLARIACSPNANDVAVLEITGSGSSVISVWDWKKNVRLYSLDLAEIPLFFSYSPAGTYIMYGKTDLNSLVIHNAKTGELTPKFNNGFGIVSFVTMSKTEKNMMTYYPSGKISYWEFNTEKEVKGYPKTTLANLSCITVPDSKRFLVASTGDDLVLIDLLSGEVMVKTPLPGIISTAVAKDGKEIACVVKGSAGTELHIWSLVGSKFIKTELPQKPGVFDNLRDCAFVGKNLFCTTANGEIKYLTPDNKTIRFSSNRLVRITGMAFSDDTIAASTEQDILLIPTTMLTENPDTLADDTMFSKLRNPFQKKAGIFFTGKKRLCVWNNDDRPYKFVIYDTNTGKIESEFDEFESPLIEVDAAGAGILTLQKNGNCKILDPSTHDTVFDYTAQGLNIVIPISKDVLIGSKNTIGQSKSPLVIINSKTGETVPVAEPSVSCYNLLYDKNASALFFIGVDRDGPAPVTNLKMRSGKDLERVKILSSYQGEDFGGTVINPDKLIYTTIGYDSIRILDGNTEKAVIKSSSVPRELFAYGKILFSVNQDFSVSLYNRSGAFDKILDFYLFDDKEWLVLYPDDTFLASKAGRQYLLVQ